mmetsp:Transcript_37190/g.76222  ORF Transcript_37190/g.76222 Transcript_37190/m.76222 type:complete len:113 (-) Transcript_37190:118-456(-)
MEGSSLIGARCKKKILSMIRPSTTSAILKREPVWDATASWFWKLRFTRPCPICKVPVQKEDGCDNIQCSQCNHRFCWRCGEILGLWEHHGMCITALEAFVVRSSSVVGSLLA